MKFGVVAIGRNEGERLKRCLASLTADAVLVYVDLGSTDGSNKFAVDQGADVIDLDMYLPFTAARARNAGFRRLREVVPDLRYVQFIDGDCELIRAWLQEAASFLEFSCGRRGCLRSVARAISRAIGLQLALRSGMGWPPRRSACVRRNRDGACERVGGRGWVP